MRTKNSYLVSADGWPTKYLWADTAAEARAAWRKITGGPASAKVRQVLKADKPKRRGGE